MYPVPGNLVLVATWQLCSEKIDNLGDNNTLISVELWVNLFRVGRWHLPAVFATGIYR